MTRKCRITSIRNKYEYLTERFMLWFNGEEQKNFNWPGSTECGKVLGPPINRYRFWMAEWKLISPELVFQSKMSLKKKKGLLPFVSVWLRPWLPTPAVWFWRYHVIWLVRVCVCGVVCYFVSFCQWDDKWPGFFATWDTALHHGKWSTALWAKNGKSSSSMGTCVCVCVQKNIYFSKTSSKAAFRLWPLTCRCFLVSVSLPVKLRKSL